MSNPVVLFDQAVMNVFAFTSFCLGACIASFLNVVIWRVPRDESIVSPPSHCPKCGAAIKWYQNIPILAWLALRGKCANCRAPISPRYILIETLGGVLFMAAFWECLGAAVSLHGVLQLLFMWIWISLMIVGSMIDFDHKLLPDFVTVGGMILGLLFAGVNMAFVDPAIGRFVPLFYSLGGLAFGFGILWLVRYFGSKAFKREAMGLGDVFLMGAVGALFGPIAVLFTMIVSSLLGSVVGVGMVVLTKARLGKCVEIPYGPYICMACLVWMFWGGELVQWYLHALRVG